jgi:hypothetical protein
MKLRTSVCFLGENWHPGDQKRKKEKEPVPPIQMLFFGKNWPKVATLWGVFFLKSSDVDNRFQHVAKIRQSS